jgi:hypothetical protein
MRQVAPGQFVEGPAVTSSWYLLQELADFDGDGTPDLLATSGDGARDNLSLYFNEGTGLGFSARRPLPLAESPNFYDTAAGDLNGDGAADIAALEPLASDLQRARLVVVLSPF